MPTGGGKKAIAVHWLMRQHVAQGGRVLWLAHRRGLLWQAREGFRRFAGLAAPKERIGTVVIASDAAPWSAVAQDHDIVLSSVQSAVREHNLSLNSSIARVALFCALIVGATNHIGLLDQALFRRFDAVFEYALPSPEISTTVMQARLALLDESAVDWKAAGSAAEGLSHAELARACEQAAKDALLTDTTALTTDNLVAALNERRAMRP